MNVDKIIDEQAFETAVDYKPWEDDLAPSEYFEYGFVQGAQWFRNAANLHRVLIYTVAVYDDHVDDERGPRQYKIPATSPQDARVMAFILDGGLSANEENELELGEIELAKTYTEVLSAEGLTNTDS